MPKAIFKRLSAEITLQRYDGISYRPKASRRRRYSQKALPVVTICNGALHLVGLWQSLANSSMEIR